MHFCHVNTRKRPTILMSDKNSQHRHTYAESGVDISVEGVAIKALTRHFTAKKKGRGSPINIEGAYAGLGYGRFHLRHNH